MPTSKQAEERVANWEKSFMAILDYKGKYGDCNVPATYDKETNPYATLYNWCVIQRSYNKRGILKEERKKRLEAIGFSFPGQRNELFEERVQELVEYENNHGHCNVPQSFGNLGNWVKKVRTSYDKQTLPQWKIDRLNEINFIWRLRPPSIRRKDHPDHNHYNQSSFTDTTTAENNDTSDDKTATPTDTTTDNLTFPPPKKKPRSSSSNNKRKQPPLSESTHKQLHQVFSEVNGAGEWGDWVSDQIDFLEQMKRSKLSDQQSCLQIVCCLQQRLQKWTDEVAHCKRELLELTDPTRNLQPKSVEKTNDEQGTSNSNSFTL